MTERKNPKDLLPTFSFCGRQWFVNNIHTQSSAQPNAVSVTKLSARSVEIGQYTMQPGIFQYRGGDWQVTAMADNGRIARLDATRVRYLWTSDDRA